MSHAVADTLGLLVAVTARATVVLLLAFLLSRLFARRSAALRHAIWTAAMIGVLLLPVAHATLPVYRVATAWLRAPDRSDAAAAAAPGPPTDGPPIWMRLERSLDDRSGDVPLAAWLVVGIWAFGVVVSLGRVLLPVVRARRMARDAVPVHDPMLLQLAVALSSDGDRVVLLESDAIDAPATVGIARPMILVPAARTWTPGVARAVLAHELAHVTRRDCLTQLIAQLACVLYWFNPLVWLAESRMCMERERACDDRVLAAGASADRYASLLLAVVRDAWSARPLPTAALAMARPSELEARLVAILSVREDRRALSRRGMRTLVVASAAVVVVAAAVRLDAAQVAPARHARHLEPDTRGDSVALPSSELLPSESRSRAESRSRNGLRGPDSALVRTLRELLDRVPRAPDDLVRERALWALARTRPDGRLVEPLIESMRDPSWKVRAYAAWTLGVSRDRRAVPALIEQLDDPIWRMRAMGAYALADIGDPAARRAMEPLVDDEAWQVRTGAVRYLRHFDDAAARALVERARRDSHIAVRLAADAH